MRTASVCCTVLVGLSCEALCLAAEPVVIPVSSATDLAHAQRRVRRALAEHAGRDVEVRIRPGVYRLSAPLKFGPKDGGGPDRRVTYRADGGKVVVSGGYVIGGWRPEPSRKGVWTADLPKSPAGAWGFRDLFVSGRRAVRARTPNAAPGDKGAYVRLAGVHRDKANTVFQLTLPKGLVRAWRNVADVEIVIHGNWAINRKKLASADPGKSQITLARPHASAIPWNRPTPGRWCYLENALEMLDTPGEWYLDRKAGRIYYRPRDGEEMTKAVVVAPVLERLIEVTAPPGQCVRNLHFEGLSLEHCHWPLPAGGYHGVQACRYLTAGRDRRDWATLEPAIVFTRARDCSVTDGQIARLGGSGIFLNQGCVNCRIEGNAVFDIAANGVMVDGTNDENLTPKNCRIANNYVHHTGVEYFGSCGIWVAFAEGTQIAHNLVHDTPYTGLSVGWSWNTTPTACKRNLIENNHIHDVMKKLADGGCIYTLGLQPGTVLRGNHLHGVHRSARTHGGAPNNGIFFDQGSKAYHVERNVIYGAHGGSIRFNQCRREWLTWKDNVFALPPKGRESSHHKVMAEVRATAGLQPKYRKKLLGR